MRITAILALFIFTSLAGFSQNLKDTVDVIRLNKLGFETRLTDPNQTIKYANQALALSQKLGYKNGLAEAFRIRGIGRNYINEIDSAINDYQTSLLYFRETNNVSGQAKIYNNIGGLYREVDLDRALNYFNQSLAIAKKLNLEELVASLYGNIGTIHQRKKNFALALKNYKMCVEIFEKLNRPTGVTQSYQNIGVLYYNMGDLTLAEEYLLKALNRAKESDLNSTIASTNLTLASIYINKQNFEKAENIIEEGSRFADLVDDSKIKFDYVYTNYELESKRGNYQKALNYLKEVYKSDSTNYKNDNSSKIRLIEQQFKFLEQQKENELTIARQQYSKALTWGSVVSTLLALFVIALLIGNVKRKEVTNKTLSTLNLEISKQKENLDKVNHHLEEIINERTLDLQTKNKKLSEYSSHLSHQIRGPVATLKGLLILEEDKLIENDELISEIAKCVSEIDDKIIHINEDLNNAAIVKLTNF